MKNRLQNLWIKIKNFFAALRFWRWKIDVNPKPNSTTITQERIEYLVSLQIACREKFNFYFDVKNDDEIKQVEDLLTRVYYRPDGSLRPGPEARKIARKIRSQADAAEIARKNAATRPKTNFPD